MLFYRYVTVAAHPFWRLFTALFVRNFIFATRFCDALIVYFRLFLNSKPFFHVSLHFVCTFRRCFFFLWLSLHWTRSFAAPSATKKQRRRFFRTHLCCPSVQFNPLTLCSDWTGCYAKCNKPRQKGHSSKNRRTEQKGRTSGEVLPLAVLSTVFYASP